MTCEEDLVTQAVRTKAANPKSHVGVYRNLVKALPWFTSVREKLVDPAYSSWFLSFANNGKGSYHVPVCNSTTPPSSHPTACSAFYHDQEQTPEVPTPSNPNPDGKCTDGYCDCGAVPCGEYLWDHRNASCREWLVNEFIMGPTAIGHPDIDFLFIDDFWCSLATNKTCSDPVAGPSEINAHSQADMGLSDTDLEDITNGWLQTMTAAQEAMVSANAFTWSLLPGQQNANASPHMIDAASCASQLRSSCSAATNPWTELPLVMGVSPGNSSNPLPMVEQEVAAFLLMRGDYAYLGYGVWGMSWPFGTLSFGTKGNTVFRPDVMTRDYGTPSSTCKEVSSGVFSRSFSNFDVTLDCNAYQAQFTSNTA